MNDEERIITMTLKAIELAMDEAERCRQEGDIHRACQLEGAADLLARKALVYVRKKDGRIEDHV